MIGDGGFMTCHDFERIRNELLDSETASGRGGHNEGAALPDVAERERALSEHAAGCPACASVSARYEVLRRAIRMWGPPAMPSAGLAERILAEIQAPVTASFETRSVRRKRPWPAIAGLAATTAAAVGLAIALPALNRRLDRSQRRDALSVLADTPVVDSGREMAATKGDPRALNLALAEATAATWDLARSASEPAARISREVLDAATRPGQSTTGPALNTGPEAGTAMVGVPSLDSLVPDTAAAGAMLQQVGDRLTQGVRPLSDTARHAFGFLLGATPTKPDAPLTRQPKREPDGTAKHDILSRGRSQTISDHSGGSRALVPLVSPLGERGRSGDATARRDARATRRSRHGRGCHYRRIREHTSAFFKSRLADDLGRLPAVRAAGLGTILRISSGWVR